MRVGDPRSPAYSTGPQLNLPPEYLLIHRVTLGAIGVLCQLEADVPLRGIVHHWQPWISATTPDGELAADRNDEDPAEENAVRPT